MKIMSETTGDDVSDAADSSVMAAGSLMPMRASCQQLQLTRQ